MSTKTIEEPHPYTAYPYT